jgi:hypothetical protein
MRAGDRHEKSHHDCPAACPRFAVAVTYRGTRIQLLVHKSGGLADGRYASVAGGSIVIGAGQSQIRQIDCEARENGTPPLASLAGKRL